MSDYTKSTNFAAKDALASGNAAKVVKGTEIDTEFNNIATAIASKADLASPALTGNPTAPTPTAGDNDTSIATTAFVSTAVATAVANVGYPAFKNRIINGAMVIDQRNTGASVSATDAAYTLDRWKTYASQTGKYTVQQNAGSVTPPAGYINYLGATSSSAYTVGASERFAIVQQIEGLNVADLAWGTANAAAVTLSFKVYSSLTGTFGGVITNSAYNRSYPFSYSVPVANTWTTISITIAGDTTGTWLTSNGVGIQVWFSLGAGATVSGTAGSWSGSTYLSATGATSVVGTNGATFYITGVQLEKGSTATSFDYRPYGTELALCQRYYVKNSPTATYGGVFWQGNTTNASNYYTTIYLPATMRATPTATYTNVITSGFTGTPLSLDSSATCLIVGQAANVTGAASYYGMNYTASAEL